VAVVDGQMESRLTPASLQKRLETLIPEGAGSHAR
jgi:hypothetical protein